MTNKKKVLYTTTLKWDDNTNRIVEYNFCTGCYDLTNKVDKLQLMIEDYYKLPAYAFLRPSVPPPPTPLVDCNQQIPDSLKAKSGPAPPDTALSNDNTTADIYKKLRDIAMQNAFEWEEKYKTLNREYKEVYQREYKQLEKKMETIDEEMQEREKKVKQLEEENERLWTAKKPKEVDEDCMSPGWYPCPRPYTWHPERKRWEITNNRLEDTWWTYYDSANNASYLVNLSVKK